MAIPAGQGTYTGLLGYDRVFEHFGDTTLPYRVIETYTYEVIDTDFANLDDLSSYFSPKFAEMLGIFSGDINVTSLDYPNSHDMKEDLVRFQKHNLSVERRTVADFNRSSEYGLSKNASLSNILPHHEILEDFSDSFSFGLSSNGDKTYSHDISFTIRSGDTSAPFSLIKEKATVIAKELLDNDPTNLSVLAFDNYGDFVSSGTARSYYNESFDELKNAFTFSKKRDVLPSYSGDYAHNLSHTINYSALGVFNVEEKIKVEGKLEYLQAQNGFEIMLVGSKGRCEGILTNYLGMADKIGGGSSTPSNNSLVRTKLSKTFNIPNLTVEGSLSYTNDPAKFEGFSRDENFNVSRAQNGVLSIGHEIQYSLYNHISGNMDVQIVSGANDIVGVLAADREASFPLARAILENVTGLNSISTGLTRTKTNVKSEDRKKTHSINISYSNDPVYDMSQLIDPFTSSAIGGFNMMSVDISDQRPADIINEYKIINRPSKTSVLSYGYQQEPARVSISFKGNIPRRSDSKTDNFITPLYYPTTEANQLLKYGQYLFLSTNLLPYGSAFNYYLADIKYNFTSSNDFGMTLEFAYSKKREVGRECNSDIFGECWT